VWKSFAWKTLTVSWRARRADTALSPHAAIQQASAGLEASGASVKVAPTGQALTFRRGWLMWRSWLAYVWNDRLGVRVADMEVRLSLLVQA
jgi:hypothetical protein